MTPKTHKQTGATLLVSLIVLLLMTMMAITVLKLGKGNAQIVGNMQSRNAGFAAAQGAIEQVVSRADFTTTPDNALPNPCDGVANKACVDLNGDGTKDITVQVTPTCVSAKILPLAAPELNFTNADDQGCLVGSAQNFGTEGATNNNSLCARMLWDIKGEATDAATSAQTTVHQGSAIRVPATTTCPAASGSGS